jgi:hypothetical protein
MIARSGRSGRRHEAQGSGDAGMPGQGLVKGKLVKGKLVKGKLVKGKLVKLAQACLPPAASRTADRAR